MFDKITNDLELLIAEWETKLKLLNNTQITLPKNSQNRNIKQIVGHMIDSASNNTHRVVHLQYRQTPVDFPNYATEGNNDRWISIQNYQNENWENMVQFWKFSNLHFCHVIKNIQPEKLYNEWTAGKNKKVTLNEMVKDFPRHFKLHIQEIEELLKIA